MSQCTKRRTSEEVALRNAEMLTLRNELDGHPRPQVYAYACNLCKKAAPINWHVTSQPYHLIKKEEANGQPLRSTG